MTDTLQDILIRAADSGDTGQLVTMWQDIFGDPPALIEDFLSLLPRMGSGCVAERGGKILGAAYLIHGFTLSCPGAIPKRCGYLYAVAVDRSARHCGLGRMVSRGAGRLGRQNGIEILCTLPAEESLYRWYDEILSLHYRTMRTTYTCRELPAASPLSAEDYLAIRESLLQGHPHVILNDAAMAFQQKLCEAYGGGLFRFEDGIFCASFESDHYIIQELLLADSARPVPEIFLPVTRSYLCSDVSFPDGLIWNLTFD